MGNRTKIKLIKAVSLVLTGLIVVTGSLIFYYFQGMDPERYSYSAEELPKSAPLDARLTREEATEDLDYLYRIISTRHLAWIDGSDIPQRVQKRYHEMRASLYDGMTVLELYRYMRELTASVGELHTRAEWKGDASEIENGQELKNALARYGLISAVDGVTYDTLLEEYRVYTADETGDMPAYRMRKGGFANELTLRLCGIDTSDGADYIFDTEEGEVSVHVNFVTPEPTPDKEPQEEDNSWVSYRMDEERGVAVITITKCKYNEYYVRLLDEFFSAIKQKGIDNIVLDLRRNGGGTTATTHEFVSRLSFDRCKLPDRDVRCGWYIDKERNQMLRGAGGHGYGGNLYVLTDYASASGAMYFAMVIRDNNLGKIVGQSSCNLPDMYTGIRYYSTPNARLVFSVSLFRFYRIDTSVQEGLPLEPDYLTAPGEEMQEVYRLIG